MKILLLVFMSEIKIDLTLKNSSFLFFFFFFFFFFYVLKLQLLSLFQCVSNHDSFFSSRFTSNLMLPACLLGMILVVNTVCNSKIA